MPRTPPRDQKPFTGGDHLTFDDFAAALLYDTQAQMAQCCGEVRRHDGVQHGRNGEDDDAHAATDVHAWPELFGAVFFRLQVQSCTRGVGNLVSPFLTQILLVIIPG